ncbi:MAG: hypothetical protein QME07_04860 [bacterium]|nr:hypothetical protein [bacterium]
MTNVHINVGDGSLGLPKDAPFDRIIVKNYGTHLLVY